MKKFKIVAITLIVLSLAAPGLYIASIGFTDQRSIANSLAKLKAMGYATTVAELNAQAPPMAQNASPYYKKLFQHWNSTPDLHPLTERKLPFTSSAIKVLDREKKFLDRVDDVRLRPKLWFDRRYDLGFDLDVQEPYLAVRIGRVLLSRGILEALERLETAAAMRDHFSEDPHFIGGWQSSRFHHDRQHAAFAMALAYPKAAFIQRLRPIIAETHPPEDLRKQLSFYVASM